VVAPAETKKIRDGQWNEGMIRVKGNHVEHWINREKVLEYELGAPELLRGLQAASKARLPAGSGTKFKSPVLLLDQGDEVAFRALRIRALAPKQPGL
jgi:hypothetical protein